MPTSFLTQNLHFVFSTKQRIPMISKDWMPRLHGYMGGIVKGLGAMPLAIGGIEDHVHLLVGLKSIHRIDYFLRDLKADSSEWAHKELGKKLFAWQRGYAGFSVSPDAVPKVRKYIENQAAHHKKKTFEEEYKELLVAAGIEFDEKYLW